MFKRDYILHTIVLLSLLFLFYCIPTLRNSKGRPTRVSNYLFCPRLYHKLHVNVYVPYWGKNRTKNEFLISEPMVSYLSYWILQQNRVPQIIFISENYFCQMYVHLYSGISKSLKCFWLDLLLYLICS